MAQQMITANRLSDGAVVFLAGGGRWVERFGDGRAGAATRRKLRPLQAIAEAGRDLCRSRRALSDRCRRARMAGCSRSRYRERIRAEGPSIPVGQLPGQACGGRQVTDHVSL